MAKVKTISDLLKETYSKSGGSVKYVFITVGTQAQSFTIRPEILKPTKDGKIIDQTSKVFQNTTLSREISSIRRFLEERSAAISRTNRETIYSIAEAFVDEFIEKVNSVNEKASKESQDFCDNYETHKKETESLIRESCIANRRKSNANAIVKKAMEQFPSKGEILSSRVIFTIDADIANYENLQKTTKDLVDETRSLQAEKDRCNRVAHRVGPVLEALFRASKQMIERGKIHGTTITSYLEAVEVLRIANQFEFASPLPDLTDFLNNAGKAIDDPDTYIDAMIMGFSRFYVSQGMLDYIPYDVSIEAGYNREIIEDIGNDPNNSFGILFKSVEEPPVTYAAAI